MLDLHVLSTSKKEKKLHKLNNSAILLQTCDVIGWLFFKGQLISKRLFGILNSPKKRTKNLTLLLWYLRSTWFCSFFPMKLKTPKRLFEINWPLVASLQQTFSMLLHFDIYLYYIHRRQAIHNPSLIVRPLHTRYKFHYFCYTAQFTVIIFKVLLYAS